MRLQLPRRGQELDIVPGETETTRKHHAELARWAGEGGVFRLAGRIHGHAGGGASIAVDRFERLPVGDE